MMVQLILCVVVLVSFIFPRLSVAEIYTYTDEQGQKHYVSSPEHIPHRYRQQMKAPAELPAITKVPQATYQPRKSVSKVRPIVLVTRSCPYCTAVEKLFHSKNIAFTKYDIKTDPKGRMLHAQLGGGGVPIIQIGSTVIRGYDPASILTALGK